MSDKQPQQHEEEENSTHTTVLEEKNKNILWAILKQIKVGQTIKHLQLPIFVLQPRSMLEKLADSFSHPNLILNLPDIQDPEQRFIEFVRWYLSSWHIGPKGVKNPLNPIIGEWFRCSWNGLNDCKYIAEQISHHPPHTAFCYYNIDKGILLNANFVPSYVKYFGNSAESVINGQFGLHVFSKDFGEQVYTGAFPNIAIKGIMIGSLNYEIVGKVSLKSPHGEYSADIEFKSKALIKGKYNQIEGKIKKGKQVLFTLEGFWDGKILISKEKSKESKVFFDTAQHQVIEKVYPLQQEQDPMESHQIWKDVVKGIKENNEDYALSYKRKLEEVQRREEKERHDTKTEWVPKWFSKTGTDENLWVFKDFEQIREAIQDRTQQE